MTAPAPIFFGRSDTFFGVCEAIGRDLGFSPAILRVAIGMGVLFQPIATVLVYAVSAIIVLATRLAYPTTVKSVAVSEQNPVAPLAEVSVAHEDECVDQPQLAMAA